MAVSRKDDKHNSDLVDEISDSFNRAVARKQEVSDAEHETPKPRFVVTGDQRIPPKRSR